MKFANKENNLFLLKDYCIIYNWIWLVTFFQNQKIFKNQIQREEWSTGKSC